MSRMGGDAGKDVGQPCLRIDAVHFCRCDQGCTWPRGASSAAIGPAEEPGFSSKSYASEAAFGGIIGYQKVANKYREGLQSTSGPPA
jgi:hypothetical protein